MSAVLSPGLVAPAGSGTLLRLLGPVTLSWQGRRNPPWAYAKLPALLALLADSGHRALRRDWIAALLWPERDAASLRRALYDLRRQLRHGGAGAGLLEGSRETLRLPETLPTDLEMLHSAWRSLQRAAFDADAAMAALALWRGDFAAGLMLPGCEEFELWLRQARARWQQRALDLALALAEHQLRTGQAAQALATARLAAERAPEAEPARAIVWRCLAAAGQRLAAVDDLRRYQDLLAAQGLAPSPLLQRQAGELGLLPAAQAALPADDRALADAIGQALRSGPAGGAIDTLLQRAETRLLAPGGMPAVLLLRRTLMLRLMHAPWHGAMARLAAVAEALLCRPLADADRLDLVQPLAMWHGWMGRGMRGEVLLRSLDNNIDDAALPAATRVRHAMTQALCHSCSTGDPEKSIRAARRGLKLARAGAVPGCRSALLMLVANAALNRAAPADAATAKRALAQSLGDGPLQAFDLVNHHQLAAQWQLQHGSAALALAEAEQGLRMAQAVPFPLQALSCSLLAISARLLMGDQAGLAAPLQDAEALARRIGSQGYLMNTLFVAAALARRQGRPARAAERRSEAQAVARACGAQRIRKIPASLLDEALAA